MDGFLCIDKAVGSSSFAVVRRVRGLLHERRAGHGGTLDPAASGLLVLALGRATRLLPWLALEPKTYEFTVRFGAATDTLDDSGEVTARSECLPSPEALVAALPRFTGDIEQSPPRYSAVKIAGMRAYRRARNDEQFQTRPRRVSVHALQLLARDPDGASARLRLVCGGGTYVRSLAADLAAALGTVGHAAGIRRIAAGAFTLQQAASSDADADALRGSLISVRQAFAQFPLRLALPEQTAALSHGREVDLDGVPPQEQAVLLLDARDGLVAMVQRAEGGRFRPVRVFAGAAAERDA